MCDIPVSYSKYCLVPLCQSTSKKFPDKIFISLPSDPKRRGLWLNAMKRNISDISSKTNGYVCEDHFKLEEDVKNYIRYKLMGGKIFLKDNVVPHIFECQARKKRPIERTEAVKRSRKDIVHPILTKALDEEVQTILKSSESANDNIEVSTGLNTSTLNTDEGTQIDSFAQPLHNRCSYRSKSVQTDDKSLKKETTDIGTSPCPLRESEPYLKIIEQPVDKFRFRYKSEMTGTHGSLNGENSDKTRKMTYPTVEICNYQGSAVIRCSIWQINQNKDDTMPHAHRLVKKKYAREEYDDPHDLLVNKDSNYQATFHSMGIIHTAKKNIVGELIKKKTKLKREEILYQENRTELNKKEEMEIKGLAEAESKSINLNVVCLRFDAFYVGENGVYAPLCPPVFSHAINNLKSALTGELKIVRMDHCTSPTHGDREIFLLVERVTKRNIKVRFYELDDEDNTIWEDYGRFSDLDVHHQYAIVLKTPPYKDRDIKKQVTVFMELVRPSDNAKSEAKEFTYIPSHNPARPGVKRARVSDFDSNDYDTKSIPMEGLPTVIQNISGELDIMTLGDGVNSADLEKALADFNSDEFKQLFENHRQEYEPSVFLSTPTISTDFPTNRSNGSRNVLFAPGIKQYSVNREEESKVQRVYKEITAFLKTGPDLPSIKAFLRHHLETNDPLNAFHLAVMNNITKVISLLVNLISRTKEYDLVNIPSKKGLGTVLHLATLCNNVNLVKLLLSECHADISATDENFNTPIHVAADEDSDGHLMKALLSVKDIKKSIDAQNKNSDTALHIAVKRKKLKVVQLLNVYGADVNFPHPSNGYTPLRFAIESQDVNMVKFFLYDTTTDVKIKDYRDVDPLQAALYNSNSQEIKKEIDKFMSLRKITCESIMVKDEPDDSSEDEMYIHEEQEIKAEPLPIPDDWQTSYQKVTCFTENCLEQLSRELDASGKWEDLASLLDLSHLIRMLKGHNNKESPSKQLLNYVIASHGGSIKEIRDFLENLDEVKAVQLIDEMVQQIHISNS